MGLLREANERSERAEGDPFPWDLPLGSTPRKMGTRPGEPSLREKSEVT